jgi:SAM-dependent methyltransferase
MTARADNPVLRQRQFYAETATAYEGIHGRTEHETAIDLSVHFMRSLDVRSVLDTGCGTGLGMLSLAKALPAARVHGNDPSAELLEIARQHGVAEDALDCVGSEQLPYSDGSFDAVIETGVLHHLPSPENVLTEMMRVARRAVFLSDDNIFGSGRVIARVAKLALHEVGLLPAVTRCRRDGHLWRESAGDGISWDYSVFTAADQLASMGADVHLIPTAGSANERLRRTCPLLFASHGLVVALKV